ncbi:MAG TPA: aminotransferase class V-fold PLP-dependent enzyme, partial [Candidatus Saccharimonadales bacterium]|nr:aminotransferase class V-fold PLP-dependent enzyme [Candidatus Saccharimonadales bacterium]
MIYANNAGTSWPKPPEVREAVAATLAAPPEEAPRLLAAAHEEIAGFLGVKDPARLLLTQGCTSALALAIGDLPWESGDVVVTSSLEHHALERPVAKLVRERGVIHRAAPYRPGLPVDPGFVSGVLGEGRVRLVALTAASNVTGEILPVEEIAGMAHRHGALCLVDAAQTAGLLPIDAERLGVDILVFAGHKGPLGPQGIGGLWAAPHVEFRSPAAACEIGGSRRADGACSPFPGYCDAGSANVAGAAGLAAGMR